MALSPELAHAVATLSENFGFSKEEGERCLIEAGVDGEKRPIKPRCLVSPEGLTWPEYMHQIFVEQAPGTNESCFDRAYARMLNDSETRGSRNGKRGMEIGRSREDDLVAAMQWVGGTAVHNEIDNGQIPDVEVLGTHFSIKHKSVQHGKWDASGMKANWTVDKDSVDKSVEDLRQHTDYGIIISLVSPIEVRLYVVGPERYSKIIGELGDGAFKKPKENTNARGVEYSKAATDRFLAEVEVVHSVPCNLKAECPIQRRFQDLAAAGL